MNEHERLVAQVVGKYLGIALGVTVPILWAAWRAKHPRRSKPSLAYRLGRLIGEATK